MATWKSLNSRLHNGSPHSNEWHHGDDVLFSYTVCGITSKYGILLTGKFVQTSFTFWQWRWMAIFLSAPTISIQCFCIQYGTHTMICLCVWCVCVCVWESSPCVYSVQRAWSQPSLMWSTVSIPYQQHFVVPASLSVLCVCITSLPDSQQPPKYTCTLSHCHRFSRSRGFWCYLHTLLNNVRVDLIWLRFTNCLQMLLMCNLMP